MTQRRNTFLFDIKYTCMLKMTNKTLLLLLLLLYLAWRAGPFFIGSYTQKQIDGSVGSHYAIALGLGTVKRAALVVSSWFLSVRRRHQHVQYEQPTHNPQEQHGDRMSSITTRSLMWRLQFIVIVTLSYWFCIECIIMPCYFAIITHLLKDNLVVPHVHRCILILILLYTCNAVILI